MTSKEKYSHGRAVLRRVLNKNTWKICVGSIHPLEQAVSFFKKNSIWNSSYETFKPGQKTVYQYID